MNSVFDEMREHHELAQAEGQEVKRWVIRTNLFPATEADARAAGALSDDGKAIFGAPFEVADRVESEQGKLFIETGPR